ncbi:MAG: HDOD domain-containing protein [Holophagaceae bacterium]|nr:HDOD domain-containing protein [Holophagaceae bacterium]
MQQIDAKKLVENLGNLPPIPHIATQVLRLTSDMDCSLSELQQAIASDQALAAQMLKIANSAMFGSMRAIRTLPQAIMTLGLNSVKSAVIASISKDFYMKSSMGFYKTVIWEHSLVSALAGSSLAKVFRFPAHDEVFLGSLLHDIGKSVLDLKFPGKYEKIANSCYCGETVDVLKAEVDAFGFDHAMVGGALLESWNLPTTVTQSVRWHHSPGNADAESIVLAAYVSLGNIFALEMGKGLKTPTKFDDAKNEALERAGISKEAYASQTDVVFECIEQDKAFVTGF